MIQVKLLYPTKPLAGEKLCDPLAMASHAGLECYQAQPPEIGQMIDVEERLFNTGHHTTLQHFNLTFNIEGIAVSDITLGLHLVSPFYNSDQRSGRFCGSMFANPNFEAIQEYIFTLWPETSFMKMKSVMEFVWQGIDIYQKNISKATEVAVELIKQERPCAKEKYIAQNAPKIAQEQMRYFVSTIFPTGLDYTINISALAALCASASTPGMLFLTKKMAEAVITAFPKTEFMFSGKQRSAGEFILVEDCIDGFKDFNSIGVRYKPGLLLLHMDQDDEFVMPMSDEMYPIDLLHFLPSKMGNSINEIKTEIQISLACMGQDQRHRTIRRSGPIFTGNFYVPPIVKEIPGMWEKALNLMQFWQSFAARLPASLVRAIAPYGAMVRYKKVGSFNAIAHEQNKRLCWCAQEEIYHLGKYLLMAVKGACGKNSRFLKVLEPYCYRTGKCAEGSRYCGRDISVCETGDYFPVRKV